jgi:hypothetical protein
VQPNVNNVNNQLITLYTKRRRITSLFLPDGQRKSPSKKAPVGNREYTSFNQFERIALRGISSGATSLIRNVVYAIARKQGWKKININIQK